MEPCVSGSLGAPCRPYARRRPVRGPHLVRRRHRARLQHDPRRERRDKQRVDQGDAQVDAHDATLLEVSLPPLPSGTYQVVWSAVARDGHRTEGSFPFQIK